MGSWGRGAARVGPRPRSCWGWSPGGESVEAGGVLLSGCQQPLDKQNLGIVSHLSVVLVALPG